MIASKLRRAARIILVGPPGCGKGTQSTRLLTKYPQLTALSSGELLRQNVRIRSPIGLEAEEVMRNGGLVPDSIMVELIVGELAKRGWIKSRGNHAAGLASTISKDSCESPSASFLLDGFPRTQSQAEKLDEEVSVNFVVNFDVPHDLILDRIANRWVHGPSGRVYSLTWNPPVVPGKDDVTGDLLTKRPDDDPDTFRLRLKKFTEETAPLLEHYDKAGVLWTVHGETSDEITPQLDSEIVRRFA